MKAKELMRVAYRVGTGEDVLAPPESDERSLRFAYDPRTAILIILVFSLLCGVVVAWTLSRPVEVMALPGNEPETITQGRNEAEEDADSAHAMPGGEPVGAWLGSEEIELSGAGATPEEQDVPVQPPSEPERGSLITVYVSGHVANPGVIELSPDARLIAAIEAAGGMTADADPDALNLARTLVDGEHILVPAPGDPPREQAAPSLGSSEETGPGTETSSAGPVNLNTAPVAELMTLPGVGPAIAGRIVDWREANGGFTTVEELMEVSGIGPATFANLEALVTV